MKSMCTSFGEECTYSVTRVFASPTLQTYHIMIVYTTCMDMSFHGIFRTILYYPLDNSGTVMGESPDFLLLFGTVVSESPDHVCRVYEQMLVILQTKLALCKYNCRM